MILLMKMRMLVALCFSLVVAFITSSSSSQVASLSATDSIEEEICNTNFFRASCSHDEIIIVETAQYGRYQLGTCILEGFGYLGCMHDVMLEAESFCSGRRSCEIRVDDTSFPRAAPCHKDLKNHLWISYRCYKVITPKNHCYPNGNLETVVDLTKLKLKLQDGNSKLRLQDNEDIKNFPTPTKSRDKISDFNRQSSDEVRQQSQVQGTNSFLLSSWVTEETGCGTADSPWVVLAGEGQRVNLTLYDFSPEAMTSPLTGGDGYFKSFEIEHSQSGTAMQQNRIHSGVLSPKAANRSAVDHGKPTCRVLATIRESPHFRSNTICSNQGRVVNVATSLTNRIELRFLVGPKSTRLAGKGDMEDSGKPQGFDKGKSNKYQLQSHFLFQIKVIGCVNPAVLRGMRVNRVGDHVTIDCASSGESWQMTCVGGVWTGHYRNCSHDSSSLHSRLEGLMPYASSIIIVGIIAVLMVCFILTAGIFCIKWRLRHDMSRARFHPNPSLSRDTEYGYPSGQQLDDRKYPILPAGAQVGSYYPVMTSGADNLNEYATMRLLQQSEQILRSGVMARAAGVQQSPVDANVSVANMMVIAENYRYPPPPPPTTKTGAMTSFLAASESPQFGYRSDHIYECPDLVRQEVSRIAATATNAAPICVQTREMATPVKVECPIARDSADNTSRNFSL